MSYFNQIKIQGYDGNTYKDALVDSVTNAVGVIEYEHHEIHDGKSFVFTIEGDITNDDYQHLLIDVPTGVFPHVLFEADVEAEMSFCVFEDVTVSDSGTEYSAYNRDRSSVNTPATRIYVGPTITDSGTCIVTSRAGSGKRIGGEARSVYELILDDNSLYDFRIRNDSGGDAWASQLFNFYEE